MGCCESRKSLNIQFESSLFSPFEKTIGLHKYEFLFTNSVLQKYSNSSHLTYFQFVGIFTELDIPLKDHFKFYDQFDRNRSRILTEKKYSYLQIQSLNVLLCSGNIKNKLMFLFSLYDKHSLRILNTVKIEEMLENLLKVALDYIPNFFFLTHPENSELVRYLQTVKTGNDKLLEKLSKKILNHKNSVTLEEFQVNVFRYFGKDILRTAFLRQNAFNLGVKAEQGKLRKTNKKAAKEPNDSLEDEFSDFTSSIVSTIVTKAKRHKKSLSNYYPKVVYHTYEDGVDDDSKDYTTRNKSFIDSITQSTCNKYDYSPNMQIHCFTPSIKQESQKFTRKSNQGLTFTALSDAYKHELSGIILEKEEAKSLTTSIRETTKNNSPSSHVEFKEVFQSSKITLQE